MNRLVVSMGAKTTSSSDQLKEQSAFVSGVALVWGLSIFGLWSTAATYQAGLDVNLWTTVPASKPPIPGYVLFEALGAILALGFGAVFSSVVHIVARGLSLANTSEAPSDGPSRLDVLARDAFVGVFVQTGLGIWMVGVCVLMLLLDFVEMAIRPHFEPNSMVPRVVVAVLGTAVFVFVVVFDGIKLRRRAAALPQFLSQVSVGYLLTSGLVFAASWITVTECCYTVALSVDKRQVSRAAGGYVEVMVELGGASSDVQLARLTLRDEDSKTSAALPLVSAGEGRYMTYLSVSTLDDRLYMLELVYPRLYIGPTEPYMAPVVRRSARLIVLP